MRSLLERPDETALATALGALANPLRLSLVRTLLEPKPLGEIDLRGGEADRPLARQTVREHLERLLEAGLVHPCAASRDARSPHEYVVNHQALFALSEELRALAHLRPLVEPSLATVAASPPARPLAGGACLVLVKGVGEGASFPLRPPSSQWLLGRKRGVDVPLDFDPFVSSENSRVLLKEGRHHVEDLAGSRNGTTLNFRPLQKGTPTPLRHGDVIGLGRTLLLYREA